MELLVVAGVVLGALGYAGWRLYECASSREEACDIKQCGCCGGSATGGCESFSKEDRNADKRPEAD